MSSKKRTPKTNPYPGPAGGWGSAKSVAEITLQEHVSLKEPGLPSVQNKAEGYMCVSCAWAKPAKTHPLEFCENGAKRRHGRRRPDAPTGLSLAATRFANWNSGQITILKSRAD